MSTGDSHQLIVTRGADGRVTLDDPNLPVVVVMTLDAATAPGSGRPNLSGLTVQVRPGGSRITATMLGRLPLRHLLYVAHAATGRAACSHPNEAHYRGLATPRPDGHRSWDPGHWLRVWAVYQWAQSTGRPGGGLRAVADLWGVTVNPTARRWLAEARRHAASQDRAENACSNRSAAT